MAAGDFVQVGNFTTGIAQNPTVSLAGVTNGNTLVLIHVNYSGTVNSIDDDKSNTWGVATGTNFATAPNVVGGTVTATVHYSASVQYLLCLAEYEGNLPLGLYSAGPFSAGQTPFDSGNISSSAGSSLLGLRVSFGATLASWHSSYTHRKNGSDGFIDVSLFDAVNQAAGTNSFWWSATNPATSTGNGEICELTVGGGSPSIWPGRLAMTGVGR
jgi:hypothetical protein